MHFEGAGYSDTGTVKEINQDSMMVKIARCSIGEIACGLICDGMGGLRSGEVASAFVVKTFADWFDRCLPQYVTDTNVFELVLEDWKKIIKECNQRIMEYGAKKGFNIGTTVSGVFLCKDQYLTINVGDSRVYIINSEIEQITIDQTVVEKEIREGKISRLEAENHPKRSILLQCVGASREVVPEFQKGTIGHDDVIMVCSDGFRHKISVKELQEGLNKTAFEKEMGAKNRLRELVETVKERGERDNISAVLIHAVDEGVKI